MYRTGTHPGRVPGTAPRGARAQAWLWYVRALLHVIAGVLLYALGAPTLVIVLLVYMFTDDWLVVGRRGSRAVTRRKTQGRKRLGCPWFSAREPALVSLFTEELSTSTREPLVTERPDVSRNR